MEKVGFRKTVLDASSFDHVTNNLRRRKTENGFGVLEILILRVQWNPEFAETSSKSLTAKHNNNKT